MLSYHRRTFLGLSAALASGLPAIRTLIGEAAPSPAGPLEIPATVSLAEAGAAARGAGGRARRRRPQAPRGGGRV